MNLHGIFCVAIIAFVVSSVNTFTISNDDVIKSRDPRSIKYNTKDSAVFLQEVDNELKALFEAAPTSFDDYIDPEDSDKLTLLNTFTKLGKELKAISQAAGSFDLSTIEDPHVKHTLNQVKNFGGIYKLGYETIHLVNNIVYLKNRYTVDYMESDDDSDYYYSVRDLDNYGTSTFDINVLKDLWRNLYDVLEDKDKYFFKTVEIIQSVADDYDVQAAKLWYSHYSEDVLSQIDEVMKELKPYYQLFHGAVRQKLVKKYGVGVIKSNGPIPEHLYQQVKAEIWETKHIFDNQFKGDQFTAFKDSDDFPTKKLFEIAENFYESLGFEGLTKSFWDENISETDDIPCTAEVDENFHDVTIKYCSTSSFNAFKKAHWHMGQVHAALLKKNLIPYFYDGYSLEKAIGQTVELAAATPKHLKETSVLSELEITDDLLSSYNFRSAIDFFFDIPYAYAEIKVLTEFLNDKIKKEDFNKYYWKILGDGGIEPPFDRSDSSLDLPYSFYRDFNENTDIIGKFSSNILAYQFYRSACQRIGHVGTLHTCDFYNSTEIGEIFKDILSQGSSKPFSEIVSSLLPKSTNLDASAVLDYFEPTINALKKLNITFVGWVSSTRQFTDDITFTDEEVDKFITESSDKIYEHKNQITKDLFENKYTSKEYENEEGVNEFWKISPSGSAAVELKEIALKAHKYYAFTYENKTMEKAVEELTKIGDVFVIGDDMEGFLYRKELLQNISIDKDIVRYKASPDSEDYVSYFPDIINVYLNSSDMFELQHYWVQWRQKNSEYTLLLFAEIFESLTKASGILETSVADFWFKHVNSDFINNMEEVINNLKPFYAKLHLYIRNQLIDKYDGVQFSTNIGAIPDHFIDQVLLQVWNNNSIIEKDFHWKDLPVTDKNVEGKDFDALKLLHTADEFYQSLGFSTLDDDFWTNRVKPQTGAENYIDCHATIYDLTPKPYIKYCEKVNYKKLLQAFSYLGQIHYAKEKHELPAYFFDSYFLEYPVGEAVLLSASTPKYSQFIGLTSEAEISESVHLNRLIRMAIHTIFNIHKFFVNTKIVFEILNDDIYDHKDVTKRYWELMIQYAGIEPPLDRKETDFDFSYKFYTDLEQNYQVKKFFSDVLGYQIYEALCKISGHKGELSTCNFHGNKEAGDKLKEMMQLGSSKPLKTVLKVLLGKRSELSANALLKYYAPVEEWLDKTLDIEELPSYSKSERQFWRGEDIYTE